MSLRTRIDRFFRTYRDNEEYRNREIVLKKSPEIMAIELTDICNFRCTFCPSFTRKSGYMDEELLKKILNETKFQRNSVALHFHGESTLHPKLGKMISLCKNKGLVVYLSTNASMLNDEISKTIIESGLDRLTFSFDGASKEIFEKYRYYGKFEKVKDNIL